MVHIMGLPNVEKFKTQFSLIENTRPNRPHPGHSEQNIAAVAESVRDESIRRRCRMQQLGVFATFQWALEKLEEDLLCSNKILFSDEAHLWQNRHVNKQNLPYLV